MFQASVGYSREWDAYKAGRNVAINTLEKLDRDPDILLLFSTIHYKDHGGFTKLLDGVWDILPKKTILVGGTTSGFLNNYGCFARGVTALAISYPNMDFAAGVGKNFKKNPSKSFRECSGQIIHSLGDSEYNNNILVEIISGPIIPKLPLMGQRNDILSEAYGNLFTRLSPFTRYFKSGWSREDDILQETESKFKNFHVIGAATIDDCHFTEDYQFFNREVIQNGIVAIGIKSDLKISLTSLHGFRKTDTCFEITKSQYGGKILNEFNKKPARDVFFKSLRWSERYMEQLGRLLYSRMYYYPLGFEKNGMLVPNSIAGIFGKNILMGFKMENPHICLLSASGDNLLKAVDNSLSELKTEDILTSFGVSCEVRLNTLGARIYVVREKMLRLFQEKPFLIIYAAGENVHWPNGSAYHSNCTFNLATFNQPNIQRN